MIAGALRMSCKLWIVCVVVIASSLLAACDRQCTPMIPATPILKIAVMADGRITVDGKPATVESLRVSLKGLAQQHGVVWYYREAGHSEPPAQATEVMRAVIDNRLPIRMSSRPDYSDAIGIDGRPITNGPAAQ